MLIPSALLEMRQWAGEQRPDVQERVLKLCDAVEESAAALVAAQTALGIARKLVSELQADTDRMLTLLQRVRQ